MTYLEHLKHIYNSETPCLDDQIKRYERIMNRYDDRMDNPFWVMNKDDSDIDKYVLGIDPYSEKQTINKMSSKFKLEVDYLKKDTSYGHSRQIRVKTGPTNTVLKSKIVPFPNCCGICIFEDVAASDINREDFSEVMKIIIEHLQSEDKYSKILHYNTDNSRVARMFSTYDKAVMTGSFKNIRSGNYLVGFEIDIRPEKNSPEWFSLNLDEEEDHEPEFDEEGEFDEEEEDVIPMPFYSPLSRAYYSPVAAPSGVIVTNNTNSELDYF